MHNSLNPFFVWLFISILINFIGFIYFNNSDNKSDISSLLAIFTLFFTIAARNYTVNHFMFHFIGNIGESFILHQVANQIGFFHRLMAISSLTWLIVHFQYIQEANKNIALILIILLAFIIISALAIFRRRHHNTFENIHRYIGYVSVVLLIAYYFQQNLQSNLSLNEILLKPHFLLLLGIVLMLISPWIGVKKVNPKLVHVGAHVIGISIPGEPTFGTYSKITLSNAYYHPFGDSMIDFNDMKNRTLYMTPAGDKTSQIIKEANENNFLLEKCTIKKNRPKGFMYHHALYNHVLIIVTGGGIAPIIPCLVLNKKTKIDVLWIGRSQVKEFSGELLTKLTDKIQDQEIGLHILDTTEEDLKSFENENYMALALEAYNHYKPEAVFVMSNQKFTIDIISGFTENNIKVYGATFDS